MRNKWLILTMVFGITLQIAVCQLPIFNMLLKTVPLDMSSWTMVLGMSFSIILINEISKWIAKERQHVAIKIWYTTPVDHWQVHMTLVCVPAFSMVFLKRSRCMKHFEEHVEDVSLILDEEECSDTKQTDMILDVGDRPPLLQWLFLSFQHVFAMFGATILVPT